MAKHRHSQTCEVFMEICLGESLPAAKLGVLLGLAAALYGASLYALGRRVP